jgi:cobalt-zinc-cadmium efflux system membrane fusion protein
LFLFGCGGRQSATSVEQPDLPRVEGNVIRFSPGFAKRIGLVAAPVKNAEVVPALSVVGTVTFDPEQVARIGTRLRGLVREVEKFEGDVVKRGDSLAEIDSPELGEAQAAVTSLRAELEAAKRNAHRESTLAAEKLTTLKESEDAQALADKYGALLAAAEQKVSALASVPPSRSERTFGIHTLRSPLDGTIVERHIARGQLVEADHTAFLVANLDHLWVELAVFERSLPFIHVGDEVTLRPMGSQEDGIKGEVANVGQVLSSSTRSAPIRVEVDNRRRLLRPGQAVDAIIRARGGSVSEGPVISLQAVTFVEGKPTVFVQDSETSARVVAIESGNSNGRELHVKRGLTAGQRVVTSGVFELKSELFR